MSDCPEHLALSRRGFLTGALAGAGVAAVYGSTVMQTSYAATGTARGVLVLLSMRGAADGMSLVVPHGDPVYYQARPRIGVPAGQLLASDGFFGLHPALAPLMPLWTSGRMAAVHAAGLPAPNRSHFAAMEELEDAEPGSDARVGWINRLVGRVADPNPLRAVQLGSSVPSTQISGPVETVATSSLSKIKIAGANQWTPKGSRSGSLLTNFGADTGPLGRGMRSAMTVAGRAAPARDASASSAYPSSDLGRALADAARTIRGNVGAEVITVDHGSWDHHTEVGTLEWGRLKQMAGDFAKSVATFFDDLGALGSNVTLVTVSEFGRRVKENDSWGLDHVYGNVMMLFGAGVRGGYHGRWPGLQNTVDADLLVTTDYRSVLPEVVSQRLGASPSLVFPGFNPTSVRAMV